MDDIIEIIDTIGNVNYTFRISNIDDNYLFIYNLVVHTDADGIANTPYIIKYTMEEDFAIDYYNGIKLFNEFTGTISKYTVDAFLNNYNAVIAKDDPVVYCPCEVVEITDGSNDSDDDTSDDTNTGPDGDATGDNTGSGGSDSTDGGNPDSPPPSICEPSIIGVIPCTCAGAHTDPSMCTCESEGGTGPIYIYSSVNCSSEKSFQKTECTPNPDCPNNDGEVGVNTARIIVDPISFAPYLCQKEIVRKSYENNSDLALTITSTFSPFNSNNINLTFKAADLLANGQVGRTDIYAEEIDNPPFVDPIYNINITIDTDYLETATDLAIAATAIHEQVHAFFVYLHETGSLLSTVLEPTYEELMQAYVKYQEDNDNVSLATTQHEYMTIFVDAMTDDLYIFAQEREIQGVDRDYCNKLVWGGLDDTQTFQTKFPEFSPNSNIPNPEHLTIINATNAEAKDEIIPFPDHPDGNDYTALPKGTPCN